MVAAAEVVAAGSMEAAAAARREALFERLQRQRAEGMLSAVRASLMRSKARTKMSQQALQLVKDASVPKVGGVGGMLPLCVCGGGGRGLGGRCRLLTLCGGVYRA